MALTVLRVVGARPQFMQAKPLRNELLKRGHIEVLLHTGQHYDDSMSKQFFTDLNLPQAKVNLGVGSGKHGAQTAKILSGIEKSLLENNFDAVVVDGDTNSTLAGALAAVKLHIPVVHIEAGMRSFNKRMPEEINRVITDHISSLLFCPGQNSKKNLQKEGIKKGVYVVGDLLAECFSEYRNRVEPIAKNVLKKYLLNDGQYVLLTLHRAENVDDRNKLSSYIKAISTSPWKVVWPMHPRTKNKIIEFGLEDIISKSPFVIIPPVGYLNMLALEKASLIILTDSGGVQREAYYWRKPGVILRGETEWYEIIAEGWAKLFSPGMEPSELWEIPDTSKLYQGDLYGTTGVSSKIVDIMEETFK